MRDIFNSKLGGVLVALLRTSPLFLFISLLLKLSFLVLQVGSIWVIIMWVSGKVEPMLVDLIGVPPVSIIYPIVGGVGLVLSAILSLFSKMTALKAIYRFEGRVSEWGQSKEVKLSIGDFRNIVKLMLGLVDVLVPVLLIVLVVTAWIALLPYISIFFALLLLGGVYLLRKGVIISARLYRPGRRIRLYSEYVGSDEHDRFYNILLLPQYISVAIFGAVSLLIVFSVVMVKLHVTDSSGFLGILTIATAMAILQMRSFVSVIVRAGAFNKSILAFSETVYGSKKVSC